MNRPHDQKYGILDVIFLILGYMALPFVGAYMWTRRKILNVKQNW